MFGRMLQNSGALLPNEVFDLTDELFLQSLLSKCNILTHEPDRLREGGPRYSIHISFCSCSSVCSAAGYGYTAAWRGVNMISGDLRALVTSLRRH